MSDPGLQHVRDSARDFVSLLAVIAMRAGATEERAVEVAAQVYRRWEGVGPVTMETTRRILAEVEDAVRSG